MSDGAWANSHQNGEMCTVTQEDLLWPDFQDLRHRKIMTIKYVLQRFSKVMGIGSFSRQWNKHVQAKWGNLLNSRDIDE